MRVLIAQTGKIGDLVCTTPLFRSVQQAQGAPVDIIAGEFAKNLLKGNDAVDKIYSREVERKTLRKEGYTHALLLMPSTELWVKCRFAGIPNVFGTVHDAMTKRERFLKFLLNKRFHYQFATSVHKHYFRLVHALGILEEIQKREIYPDESDRKTAEDFFSRHKLSGKKFAGISVTGGKNFKDWGTDNFVKLVDRFIADEYIVIGVGADVDREKMESVREKISDPKKLINTAGQFTLGELAAVLKPLDTFVAADTGPLYIADAMEVPVVDLMGPCSSRGQHPIGDRAVIVGECGNSEHLKCYMMNCPNFRARDFSRCMHEIKVDEVWEAARSYL